MPTVAARFACSVEEMSVTCLQPGSDSLLHVGVFCKSLASQTLLMEPKQMEIAERDIATVNIGQ
jgi:hypothetical protein